MMARRTTTASSRKDELTKLNEVDENRRQDDSNNNDISKETGDDGHDDVVQTNDKFLDEFVVADELSIADRCVQFALSGLSRWDSIHFLHIMQYGYTYENTLAFFPLFPTVVYYSTVIWSWAVPFIHFTTALMLTAVTINFVCFVVSAQLLYALVLAITKSAKISLLACLVLTLNPASIFFSAIYSETLFMLFTLCGLLMLYIDPTLPFIRHILAAFFFGL
ncbi:unnamed protein product, partial [Anisakis simplex]|uniref:GPI mannosyltransferase 2 n=1 Tax=Anisakis simplex TaxID=6269 RepID=A0A0M3KFR9_ANISI